MVGGGPRIPVRNLSVYTNTSVTTLLSLLALYTNTKRDHIKIFNRIHKNHTLTKKSLFVVVITMKNFSDCTSKHD